MNDRPCGLRTLPITDIAADVRCQPRAALDPIAVAEYAERMREGASFPAAIVIDDGSTYWLADGFHRLAASAQAGREVITCDVRPGTWRDAVIYAAGANATHGLRRSNADKRRAVETLLRDDEWSQWSDREIARRCGVSHPFVAAIRAELVTGNDYQSERTYTTKHGTTTTMSTGNIGRRPVETPWPDELPESDWAYWESRPVILPPSGSDAIDRAGVPMTAAEFDGLKRSIARFGLFHPIMVDQDGAIIDGRYRALAWDQLRSKGHDIPVDCPRIERHFADDDERIEYWVRSNLLRRSSTLGEIATLAVDYPDGASVEHGEVLARIRLLRAVHPHLADAVDQGEMRPADADADARRLSRWVTPH